MKAFLNYYKWHIFFLALFIVCILVFTVDSCRKSVPDLKITCFSTGFINEQTFNDAKSDIEGLLHDADGDGHKRVHLTTYTYDEQSDLDLLFETFCVPKDSDIVIATKKTLENFKEKDMLVDATEYVHDAASGKLDVLKDSNGRVYAISVEGNEYLKKRGFHFSEGLYIAVVAEDKEAKELSANKKNARNIAQYIVRESDI